MGRRRVTNLGQRQPGLGRFPRSRLSDPHLFEPGTIGARLDNASRQPLSLKWLIDPWQTLSKTESSGTDLLTSPGPGFGDPGPFKKTRLHVASSVTVDDGAPCSFSLSAINTPNVAIPRFYFRPRCLHAVRMSKDEKHPPVSSSPRLCQAVSFQARRSCPSREVALISVSQLTLANHDIRQ